MHDFHFLKDAVIASFSCLFNHVSILPVLSDSRYFIVKIGIIIMYLCCRVIYEDVFMRLHT